VLIVVDDSETMEAAQHRLAGAIPALVERLMDPPADHGPALQSLRVALVTGDMGLSWGGNPFENGDGWPGTAPCGAVGDNGALQSCAEEPWIESTAGVAQGEIAAEVGECVSEVFGSGGCVVQQPLQSAAKAVHRDDQSAFVRDGAVLAILVITDEDDCSIESNGLFGAPEIQEHGAFGTHLACALRGQYLYESVGYLETFEAVKTDAGGPVVFGAITGVPPGSSCEGSGVGIVQCLEQPEMGVVPGEEGDGFPEPACVTPAEVPEATRAMPARRLVELAQAHGSQGYIASICHADWSTAMRGFAEVIVH
jgi:hypothetical protein